MTNSKQELAALLARTARADRRAFAEFYARTSSRVYGMICDVTAQTSLRQTAMQDVYMLIWQSAFRYDPSVEDPITWTMSLAHRQVVDQARTSPAWSATDHRTARSRSAPGMNTCSNDKSQANEHESIRMVYCSGMTYQKVAETLGVTEETVKARIRDGVRSLEHNDTGAPHHEY